MPKPIPDDPSLPGGDKGSQGSKASSPLGMPGTQVSAFTASDQAVALPILYGTAKIPVLLIEKAPPIIGQPRPWTARFYEVGEIIQSNGGAYICVVRGTAVFAPTGSDRIVSTGFLDGASYTIAPWTTGQTMAVNDLRSNAGNAYRCTVAGTCGTGGPTGTGVDEVDFPGFPAQPHWTYVDKMPYAVVVDATGSLLALSVNVVWHFLSQIQNYFVYSQIVVAALCEGEVKGARSLWWDKTRTPALSLTSPGKALQLLKGPDAGGQVLPVINDPNPQTAEGIGSISGTVLTVTGLNHGSFRVGMVVTGSAIVGSALIASLGTGTGAAGTYNITPSQTAASNLIEAVDSTPLFDPSGYQHTALLAPLSSAGIPTGTQTELPDIAVELQGVMFGSSGVDVNPADIVNDILTHARRGSQWPSGRVDVTVTGTGASDFRVCCDAYGIRFSLYLDQQRSALSILADILNATDCDAIWSGGKLKIVPLCDEATTTPVFGSTNFSPANTAQYDLGPDDFLKDTSGPVQVLCADYADTFNSRPVEYIDRQLLYATTRVEDFDQTDVEARGFAWRGSTISLPMIFPDGTVPIMLSRRLTQRSLYCPNEYVFKLSWKYLLLEPTDIVTLADELSGLAGVPVRITQMAESGGQWTVTAEDYPEGVSAGNGYTPQRGDGLENNVGSTTGGLTLATQTAALTNPSADLWPNGTSENNPAANIQLLGDGSSAEYDFRLNLANAAIFTASISGTTLTVTTISSGSLLAGQRVDGAGVAPGTYITGQLGGTAGGVGTYSLNLTQTIVSESMSSSGAYSGDWIRQLSPAAFPAVLNLQITIPCTPGERIYFAAQGRTTAASGSGSVLMNINFIDGKGNILGSGGSGGLGATVFWSASFMTAPTPAPTGTVKANVVFTAHTAGVGTPYVGQIDSIIVRRIVDPGMIAPGASNGQVLTMVGGVPTWV